MYMSAAERFDSLTELLSRQGVIDKLLELIALSERYKQNLSLSLLDIDNLNKVNERYGQFIGDAVLENVARIIHQNIRGSDIAGRYGDDEFVIVLPRSNLYAANVTAERIRNTIQEAGMKDADGKAFTVTVSQGLATWEQGENSQSLLSRAEENLIKAKKNGRNRVEM